MVVHNTRLWRDILWAAAAVQAPSLILVLAVDLVPGTRSSYVTPVAILALPPVSLGLVFCAITARSYRHATQMQRLVWLVLASTLAGAYLATDEAFDALLWTLAGIGAAPALWVWEIGTFAPRVAAVAALGLLASRLICIKHEGPGKPAWHGVLAMMLILVGILIVCMALTYVIGRWAGILERPQATHLGSDMARLREGLFHGLNTVAFVLSAATGTVFVLRSRCAANGLVLMACLGAWIAAVGYIWRLRVFLPPAYGNVGHSVAVAAAAGIVAASYSLLVVARRTTRRMPEAWG